MGSVLAKAAAVSVGVQWTMFVPSALFKTEKFYDLVGGSTFVLIAWLAKSFWAPNALNPTLRQQVITGLITAWGSRLSLFLFSRIMSAGADSRFNGVRDNPKKLFVFWTIQALWIWLSLSPTLLMHSRTGSPETVAESNSITMQDKIGWALWAVGFFFETVADLQKSAFRSVPSNADKWVDSGLWSISRHPNYFGEILMWSGIYLSCTSVIKDLPSRILTGLASPAFITYLLTRVSGIPILERMSDKKWGNNPAYVAYKRRTAVLVPFLW
eukprot:TRINITY_DN10599_c0_g1_i1.p1 TRINITY_DN10599_c0_g1~~TRINITY_DN10599_c0_g1_i1.p1  ORF type:complete len:270 (+),score=28.18 TRINITY_DN10599_c0_g1_i1:160-969(+)